MTAPELSLCVGVTGHRDIEASAEAAVEAGVREAFGRLEKELSCPILVLSSLAEGADRVVARIGLDRGHQLIVPLPLSLEDYARDFETAESRRQFDALLARATRVFVVETLPPQAGEAPRETAYRSAGVAVARTCHVLLALWNGIDNGKPGGTADIVAIKLRGEPGSGSDPAEDGVRKPHGAVIRIVTPRASDRDKPKVALQWPAPKGNVWRRVAAMARRIRRFNRDAARLAARAPERIAESRGYLHDGAPPAPAAAAKLGRFVDLYAVADALAIHHQAQVRRGWRLLLLLGIAGVVAISEYAHGHGHPWQWLLGYIVVIAGALGLYWTMKAQRTQPRFLEYRALAEALRVAFFWRTAGLPGEPADRYPGHIAREVESVSMALRTEEIRVERPAAGAEGLAFTLSHWVEGQHGFFERAAKRNVWWGGALKLASNVAITVGVGLAVAALALRIGPWPVVLGDEATNWMIRGMVLLPAIGGALATYTDRLGHDAQARQYERMLDLFDPAIVELRAYANSPDHQRETMARLASEALSEHAHWVVLHRQRPFEVKAGG